MEHVIVERLYAEPVTVTEIEEALAEGRSCLGAHRVRHMRTTLSLDGKRAICEYIAPDAETVRRLNDRLGCAYERVWTARVLISRDPDQRSD